MKRLILVASLFGLGIFSSACTSDDALSACNSGQKKCDGNKIVSCTDIGSWDNGVACVAPNGLCDASVLKCVAEVSKCNKGDKICNGNTLLSCLEDGSWDKGVECLGDTPRCDMQLKKCVATIKDCQKNEKKCEGNTLHICSANGSWDAGSECKGETPICDPTKLECIATTISDCKKDEKKCEGNTLHICSADGSWDSGLECSGATPICDPTKLECIATTISDCKEGNKKCEGNMLHTCSVDGSWDAGSECKGETPICDATKLECVAALVCTTTEDCKDLATTCLDDACLKISLKDLSGPEGVQVGAEVDFVLSLNANVRKVEGIKVKVTADREEVSINGEGHAVEVVIPKDADQIVLKIKVNAEASSYSRSYTITAFYDGVTVDARFNLISVEPICIGNMILKNGKEPQNCSQNQVCVSGDCVDFEIINMMPSEKEVLRYGRDYLFVATANAEARKNIQITPSGTGVSTSMRSFTLNKGDKTVQFIVHVSDLVVSEKQASVTLKYNDNKDEARELTQSYMLQNCEDGETKCNDNHGVLICNKGKWETESLCPKSHICLPSTQACGSNTLRSISPHFALIRDGGTQILTLELQTEASASVSFFFKTSSKDLNCEKLVVPSGDQVASTTCKANSEAVLGQLITVDVYDNDTFTGEKLDTVMIWLSAIAFGPL